MLWFEGSLTAGTTVPFDLADRGLLLGDGVFDTALAIDGRIAYEAAHIERLVRAAQSLGFPVDPGAIAGAMRAVAESGPRVAIRTTLTRGSGPRGLAPPRDPAPVLWASAAPLRPGLAFAPLRLWPTTIRRNETSPVARLKSLGYLDAVLAAREAAEQGFDEALFLNTRGRVACAGTGNLFAIFRDTLATPPLGDGVLDGIVRAELLGIASALRIAAEVRSMTLDELEEADAVVLTNSLRLLAPVQTVGARDFASAGNPVVAQLREALCGSVAAQCGVPDAEVS